mgnify:CR=1 FL=1
MRFRAVISYFGKEYVGWQRQLNGPSVQEALERALSETFGAPTQATASGRTDAGVHAEGQVVHFDADTAIPPEKIPFAVNTRLPDDISMLSCEPVSEDFNARFSAKRKTYRYDIYVSRHRRPVLEQTHAHVVTPLSLTAMRACADAIEGEHDFKGFEASGSAVKSTVRTVYSIELKAEGAAEDGTLSEGRLSVYITGNGFLYNMVRIIAGTLVYAGQGKLRVEDVERVLETGDRTLAGKTLPPHGLTLVSVGYGEEKC